MTEREEIDLLRRDLADLRARVTKLEAERAMITVQPAIGLPMQPGKLWGGQPVTLCSCPAGFVCGNSACPRRSFTTTTTVMSADGKITGQG